MIAEQEKQTSGVTEMPMMWGTAGEWAESLGVPESVLRECLIDQPTRPAWVRMEEFEYIAEVYSAETVAQACADLVSKAIQCPEFALASEELLEHAKAVGEQVRARVRRAIEQSGATAQAGQNRIMGFVS